MRRGRAPRDWLELPGYRTLARIARRGVVDVYDVWSEERECRCVAKTPRLEAQHRSTRAGLMREGELLLGLAHPHIVRCYAMVRRPRPVVILETLTGATLAHVIATSRLLRAMELAVLGHQICSALHYLHGHAGVLHLDLKPSNIVAEGGRAKVIDFNIARRPGRGQPGVGSPHYLAPEQARGEMLTEATDVWGLGAVLFEGATGRRPFAFRGGVFQQLHRQSDPVREHRRLPNPLAAAIDACLAPEPSARPTVGALARILEAFA